MIDKPPPCLDCPAYGVGVGFVPPDGPRDARLALVGQGPGDQEAYHERPFYPQAPSGYRLDRWLYRSGIGRNARTGPLVTNVVWCHLPKGRKAGRPFGNRDPERPEIEHCWRAHLGPLLDSMPKLERIVPIGTPAIRWFLGLEHDAPAEKYVGTTTRQELPSVRA